jgi:sigma-E factor negative regulatory protein RseB
VTTPLGWCRLLLVACLMWVSQGLVWGQATSVDLSLNAWLLRVHEASRQSVYTGTFVVSAGSNMASARIWHFCDGAQQLERVESLSGTPRSIFRRNDQVVTFFPQSKIAVAEVRESLGLFPSLLKTNASSIGDFYRLRGMGTERIAGFESDVFQLLPVDRLRYGYRVWSERKTGLIVQLQTLDLDGKVLEQAAFSELQLDANINVGKLSKLGDTEGYQVVRPDLQKTTAHDQGWALQKDVDGFKPMVCFQRRGTAGVKGGDAKGYETMQWMFSDGVATVSLFVEAYDRQRHVREGFASMGGATHTLTRRANDWWVTVVGEVPPVTLNAFAQALERKK